MEMNTDYIPGVDVKSGDKKADIYDAELSRKISNKKADIRASEKEIRKANLRLLSTWSPLIAVSVFVATVVCLGLIKQKHNKSIGQKTDYKNLIFRDSLDRLQARFVLVKDFPKDQIAQGQFIEQNFSDLEFVKVADELIRDETAYQKMGGSKDMNWWLHGVCGVFGVLGFSVMGISHHSDNKKKYGSISSVKKALVQDKNRLKELQLLMARQECQCGGMA